jgi:potassium-transporting ATPase KdpC subunit
MKTIITSIKLLVLMTILTGIIYPVFIYVIAKTVFPYKAGGELIESNGKIIGSELFGQKFTSKKYFQPRPSAIDYQPMPSGGSNLAPTSITLKNNVDSLRKSYIIFNELPENTNVPPDAIFSSASGIDPHISPENAILQISRIAKERNYDEKKKNQIIEIVKNHTEKPQFSLFGEERINVLILNLEIDKL